MPRRGLLGEIDRVALERLIFRFGILIGHALRAADGDQRFQDGVVRGARLIEQAAGGIVFLIRDAEQQMLGGNELVFEVFGFLEGGFENLLQAGEMYMPVGWPVIFGHGVQLPLRLVIERIGLDAAFFENRAHDALALAGERDQQMQRMNRLMPVLAGDFLRLLNGFLRFLC